MMGQKKITLVIDKVGRPKIEGHGMVGKECDRKMKPIEDAFRGGKVEREDKAEYHMPEQNQGHMHLGT
tara:strand:+ start:522 stop:725 length:204 start_codon:yes stop_codon:yes gene_type:complete